MSKKTALKKLIKESEFYKDLVKIAKKIKSPVKLVTKTVTIEPHNDIVKIVKLANPGAYEHAYEMGSFLKKDPKKKDFIKGLNDGIKGKPSLAKKQKIIKRLEKMREECRKAEKNIRLKR